MKQSLVIGNYFLVLALVSYEDFVGNVDGNLSQVATGRDNRKRYIFDK